MRISRRAVLPRPAAAVPTKIACGIFIQADNKLQMWNVIQHIICGYQFALTLDEFM
jgi:hypothetical protein